MEEWKWKAPRLSRYWSNYYRSAEGWIRPDKCLNRTYIINIIMLTHFEGPAGLFFMFIRLDLNRPKNRFGRGYRSINRPLLGSAHREAEGQSFMRKHVKCREDLPTMTIFKILSGLGQGFGDYGARGENPGKEFYLRSLISKP